MSQPYRPPRAFKGIALLFFYLHTICKVCGSAVCTATGYELDDRGSEFESRLGQKFSLIHPARIQWLPGGEAAWCEVGYSPPTSAEVKKT
jgi:hypothetical protein